MADEKVCDCKKMDWNKNSNASGGAVYGFGLIGALIYFLSNADSFWNGVLGILKAIVWPAMLIYHLLGSLQI